jgi:hypothetical protein
MQVARDFPLKLALFGLKNHREELEMKLSGRGLGAGVVNFYWGVFLSFLGAK